MAGFGLGELQLPEWAREQTQTLPAQKKEPSLQEWLKSMSDAEREAVIAPVLNRQNLPEKRNDLNAQLAQAQALREARRFSGKPLSAGNAWLGALSGFVSDAAGTFADMPAQQALKANTAERLDPKYYNNPLVQRLLLQQLEAKALRGGGASDGGFNL